MKYQLQSFNTKWLDDKKMLGIYFLPTQTLKLVAGIFMLQKYTCYKQWPALKLILQTYNKYIPS